MRFMTFVALLVVGLSAAPQNPPPQQSGQPPQTTPAPQGGRQGGRGRGVAVMTLTTSAWADGGIVSTKHTQAGDEVSPPLVWNDPPENTQSFLLIVHDIDATNADGLDVLHWMVWNIPAKARGLAEHVPQGPELADGSRQISVSGPYYRGPGAPATGPEHHYVFDLYALDTMLDVKPVGAPVAQTRAAIMAAIAGHVRGKASMVGRFKY